MPLPYTPSTPAQDRDSFVSLRLRILARIGSDNYWHNFPAHHCLQNLKVTLGGGGMAAGLYPVCAGGSIDLFIPTSTTGTPIQCYADPTSSNSTNNLSFGYVQKKLLTPTITFAITFNRIQFDGEQGQVSTAPLSDWRPLFTMLGVNGTVQGGQEGYHYHFDLMDAAAGRSAFSRSQLLFPSYEGTYAEIVQQVATLCGWSYVTPAESGTDGTTKYIVVPHDKRNPLDFIAWLATKCFSDDGTHFVAYLDYNKRLFFGPIRWKDGFDYAGQKPVFINEGNYFRYSAEQQGNVISFTPSEDHILSLMAGGGGAASTGSASEAMHHASGDNYDLPKSRESGVAARGAGYAQDKFETAAPNGNTYVDGELQTTKQRDYAEGRDDKGIDADMTAVDSKQRMSIFKAQMSVMGTHNVRPLDYLRIDYFNADGKVDRNSGIFQAETVDHEINAGGWTTNYALHRAASFTDGMDTSSQSQTYSNPATIPLPTAYDSQGS